MADFRFVSLAYYLKYCSCMLFSTEEFQQFKYYSLKFGIKFRKSHKKLSYYWLFSVNFTAFNIAIATYQERTFQSCKTNFIKHKKNTFKV